jgi:hypothetical protein
VEALQVPADRGGECRLVTASDWVPANRWTSPIRPTSHAERVIRRLIGRYAEHSAVIGFQVDNELSL